ncbi:hypothetical protein OSB04_013761 [Centaurea solstitialis]|uniref:Uncharacterized protein n=1 Tax=Centaurea solstitialis TaxID=347529 RepID=A0AA38WFB6_9ASTR|nr:hypothetical protein OSB04_013761 [Centaurea solstitialis]
MFHEKGSYGIRSSLTENIRGSKCQNYFIGKTTCDVHHSYNCNCAFGSPSESKTVDKFGDFSKSFIYEENKEEDNLPSRFAQNEMEEITICRDVADQDCREGVGAVTHKRSRKPTKRYIDESSNLNLRNCKKRREAASVSKVKISKIRRPKIQNDVEFKEKLPTAEISFGKAIQVPFISQGPTECRKINSPPPIENTTESYSSDDSEMMTKSEPGGNPRKHHRLWSVSEVKKLIDGVAHFGVGKWTHIKKLLFSTSVHRTPVDLKDKWRNLLKASRALNGNSRIEDEQKRSQPWRPLPKSILCRVRELASVYPYPREGNSKISKSKFPLARHVSSPARIKGNNNNNNQVHVV